MKTIKSIHMQNNKTKCDCHLGTLNDLEVYKSDIVERISEIICYQEMHRGKIFTVSDIFDSRRGWMFKHNYCAFCGNLNNWKQLKENTTIEVKNK